MAKLTAKQQRFVEEYLIDLNATQAAIRAGYSVKTAEQVGYQLLQKTSVSDYIQKRIKDREKRTEITQDMVLQELAKLGFFDIRKLFGESGKPKDITSLDDVVAASVVGMDIMDLFEGNGEDREFVGYVKKYKMADKIRALELIGRHLGMWKDKVELSGGIKHENPFEDLTTEELKKLIRDG